MSASKPIADKEDHAEEAATKVRFNPFLSENLCELLSHLRPETMIDMDGEGMIELKTWDGKLLFRSDVKFLEGKQPGDLTMMTPDLSSRDGFIGLLELINSDGGKIRFHDKGLLIKTPHNNLMLDADCLSVLSAPRREVLFKALLDVTAEQFAQLFEM